MNLFESCTPLIHKKFVCGNKPYSLKLGDRTMTIAKLEDGYYAFPKRCPHRGTDLKHARVEKDCLVCPYHGWQTKSNGDVFHSDGNKRNCKSDAILLTESHDFLWLNNNKKQVPLAAPANMTYCGGLSFDLSAPFHVVLDNFNEGSHTPFVHRYLGSEPKDMSIIDFDWEDRDDHVFIKYLGPQRPNFLFSGPLPLTYLNWDIEWTTRFDPVRMEYLSKWRSIKTGKVLFPGNYNCYFVTPNGKDRTWLHAFVFTEIPAFLRPFEFFVKKVSLYMTKNQVMEDEVFYQKINDIPLSFKSMNLDRFDRPLVAIRKKVDPSYFGERDEV